MLENNFMFDIDFLVFWGEGFDFCERKSAQVRDGQRRRCLPRFIRSRLTPSAKRVRHDDAKTERGSRDLEST
jgi:hypothetical protein